MPNDKPIAYTEDGRPLYDNVPTVTVVALVDTSQPVPKILVVKRAHNPGAGLWALPGGFHMRGESWRDSAAREVYEETGYNVNPFHLTNIDIITDEFDHNVLFSTFRTGRYQDPHFDKNWVSDGEILESRFVDYFELKKLEWAFGLHYKYAVDKLYNFDPYFV